MVKPPVGFVYALPAGFMYYQSPLFSESKHAKAQRRHVLGGLLIKWVTVTTVSSCYGCNLAIFNPPILPEHAFCIVHRNVRHYNDSVPGLPKITTKPVNVLFHPRISTKISRYFFQWLNCITRIFLPSQYGTFIIAKTRNWICFSAVSTVDQRG